VSFEDRTMPHIALLDQDIDAFAFDAYGTLFDVHAAVSRHADSIGPQAAALSETWRVKQLEYAWVLSLAGRYETFWRLTELALDYALERHAIAMPGLRSRLLDVYRSIPPFADARPALVRLRTLGCRVAILTNADRAMIAAAVDAAGLGDVLDDVVSIEDVGRYKTHPEAYSLGCRRLASIPERTAFVSSNGWDVAGGGAFGLQTIRIRRGALPLEYPDLPARALINSLAELR
jgi:2-haloacid dehalogenase